MADMVEVDIRPTTTRPDFKNEATPVATWILRGVGICTIIMVVIALIVSILQGRINPAFFLLTCNILVSSIIGVLNAWWYRRGDLTADKHWYMVIVAFVIIFQCVSTDIYVFVLPSLNPSNFTIPETNMSGPPPLTVSDQN